MRALVVTLIVITLVSMGVAWWEACEVGAVRIRCCGG